MLHRKIKTTRKSPFQHHVRSLANIDVVCCWIKHTIHQLLLYFFFFQVSSRDRLDDDFDQVVWFFVIGTVFTVNVRFTVYIKIFMNFEAAGLRQPATFRVLIVGHVCEIRVKALSIRRSEHPQHDAGCELERGAYLVDDCPAAQVLLKKGNRIKVNTLRKNQRNLSHDNWSGHFHSRWLSVIANKHVLNSKITIVIGNFLFHW